MRIDAAVTEAAGAAFAIQPIDLDAAGDDDVLIRIAAVGICHTDLVMRDAALPWPGILGHEGAGVIERLGRSVEGFKVGEHVVLTTASCGACANCYGGLPSWCLRFAELNLGGGRRANGSCSHSRAGQPLFGRFFGQSAFATHAVVSARSIVPVPADLPLPLLAPLGCGVQTGAGAVLNTLRPAPGSSIAVFGVGAVGLSAVMAARIAGCRRIVAIDRRPERLALALELGASETVDAAATSREDVTAAAAGVDFAVEASGAQVAMEQTVEVLGMNGVAALVGIAPGLRPAIDLMKLQGHNLTIKSSVMAGAGTSAQRFVPRLVAHLRAGELPIERFIRYYDFADIDLAIRQAEDGTAVKPVLLLSQRVATPQQAPV